MDGKAEKRSPGDNPESDGPKVLPAETQTDETKDRRPIHCRWCSSPLPVSAKVCPTCRGHQKWIWNYFSQVFLVVSTCISVILVLTSAANVYLTKRNLNEAEEEKTKAKEALHIAQSASQKALDAQAIALGAQSVLHDLSLLADVNTAAISAPYDIRALRKLWAMSHNTNGRIRVLAEKQLKSIISQLHADYEMVMSDYWGFKHGAKPQYYGFNSMEGWRRLEFVNNYMKVPHDRRIVYVTQFLSDNKENNEEKFAFCYSIFKLESRPDVIYTLSAFVDTKAKLHKNYLFDTEYYLSWLKNSIAKRGVPLDRILSQ